MHGSKRGDEVRAAHTSFSVNGQLKNLACAVNIAGIIVIPDGGELATRSTSASASFLCSKHKLAYECGLADASGWLTFISELSFGSADDKRQKLHGRADGQSALKDARPLWPELVYLG